MKLIVLTIFSTFVLIDELEAFTSMGPVGNIIINSVYECPENEKPTGDYGTWSVKLSEHDGRKVVSGTATTKIPVDDNINYHLVLKKWETGSWKKYIEVRGPLCTDMQKLLPRLWSKAVVNIKLDPGRACPAQPGTYSVENLHVNSKDLDVKAIFYGKMLLKVTASDKSKKTIFCAIAEGDSQAAH